jgi:predicted AAA+ superfamily ATPase
MFQLMQKLLDKGVPVQNILCLNFFDDRLHRLQHEGLGVISEAYYALYPEKKNSETVYCFFDEIQTIPGWEAFVDRLLRTERCEVYLTGSSALLLSKEIATQMRGRALSWEMFPFSFKEFLAGKGVDAAMPLSTKKRLLVQKAFDDFWVSGGFPEVIGLEKRLRQAIHQEYFNAILFRDLVERHDISHPKAVLDLAHWLVENTACLYTINKLTGYLKALGHKVPKASVAEYMAWFEDSYFLFTVRIFDASLRRANANPKKIYCVDHSFVNSVSSGILLNSGHLLESLVFTALRRDYKEIYYYRTKSGKEVDFMVLSRERKRLLVQVCESLADAQVKKRELAALEEAMLELKLDTASIITRSEDGEVMLEAGKVEILPAWRFLIKGVAPGC